MIFVLAIAYLLLPHPLYFVDVKGFLSEEKFYEIKTTKDHHNSMLLRNFQSADTYEDYKEQLRDIKGSKSNQSRFDFGQSVGFADCLKDKMGNMYISEAVQKNKTLTDEFKAGYNKGLYSCYDGPKVEITKLVDFMGPKLDFLLTINTGGQGN